MKDLEIFNLLQQATGISNDAVIDFRPCSGFYGKYGIPFVSDAITVQLKGNGSLIYIPDNDMEGNQVKRELFKEQQNMRAKIIMQDGVLQGVLMTPEAKSAGLKLDIVDADSACDSDMAVRNELSESDMEFINISVRHPKMPEE